MISTERKFDLLSLIEPYHKVKREMIKIFYSEITDAEMGASMYPPERLDEINRVKSIKAKREKYQAWKLLEYAVGQIFNEEFVNFKFAKNPNGKWICDKFCFSISHTTGMVAVAVSDVPVGVDIEEKKPLRSGIEGKILTERELTSLIGMDGGERECSILRMWCAKEAIFKSQDREALLPKATETADFSVRTEELSHGEKRYILAIAPCSADETAELLYIPPERIS